MLRSDHIPPALIDEFVAAVELLRSRARPELTVDGAVLEAIDDWITLVRFEHFDGDDIPGADRRLNFENPAI